MTPFQPDGSIASLFGAGGLTISKDDVVAIAVARKEEQLKADLAATLKAITGADESIVAFNKSYTEALEKFAKGQAASYIIAFTEFAKKYVKEPEFHSSFAGANNDGTFNVTINSNNYYKRNEVNRFDINFSFQATRQQYITDIKDQANAAQKHKEQLQTRTVDIKRELASLSSLERKTRAAIAIDTLKATKAGQDILKTLSVVSDKPLLLDFSA